MRASGKPVSLVLVIIWLAIAMSAIFAYGVHSASDLVTVSVMPQAPRKGEPVILTVNLTNPGALASPVSYDILVNRGMVQSGSVVLNPLATRKYSYVYVNDLELGEQAIFTVRASTPHRQVEEVVTVPGYAPQVWSSFVAFASFSTSVMGSITTMVYYQDSFIQNQALQVGLVVAVVLILLLLFRELTMSSRHKVSGSTMVLLRVKFGVMVAILLIIFLGMIFTRIVMVLR